MNIAYFEISRGLKFWDTPIEAHIEYNGGFGRGDGFAYSLNNAYLVGPSYTWNNEDWSNIFTLKVHYKYNEKMMDDPDFNNHNVQLTAVWLMKFLEEKITFTGFADFWTEKVPVKIEGGIETADYVFITEPQLWYNFTKNFAAGTEVEMSTNFALNKGFMINPTAAVMWTF